MKVFMSFICCLLVLSAWRTTARAAENSSPPTIAETLRFDIRQPVPGDRAGGIFAHDLTGDGKLDYLLTSDGHVGAYSYSGETLWINKAPISLSPYTHHPSAIAGDMNGDGKQEVAYLLESSGVRIVDGKTGARIKTLPVAGKPDAIAIANLRGKGDREILLQYGQTKILALDAQSGARLWETDAYRGIEHSPLRQADIDGDGLDEIAGATLIDHDGKKMNSWDLGGIYRNMDSIVIADIIPGYPLEVVLAEQRGGNSHTDMVTPSEIVFRSLNPWNWEDPDKLAVGDFDLSRPGLEIFNRSSGGDGTARRGNEEPFRYEICPWVLDAQGDLITKYYFSDHKPQGWTGHGLEEIFRIDWDGDARDEIVGKERHKNGAGAIIDPISGKFKALFKASALRIYAADVSGDAREEVIIVDADGFIRLYQNKSENKNPPKPSPWKTQHYRRQKQNWNYYSP